MSGRLHRDPPVQLRIGFPAPTRPATVHLSLSGLDVMASAASGTVDDVFHHLSAAGIVATVDPVAGIMFPASAMPLLRNLPDQVNVVADQALSPLYLLATNPSHDNLPATLSRTPNDGLELSWFDGNTNWHERFDPVATPALLNAELPFVATTDAWEVFPRFYRLPVLAGRASVNLDGYVEIATTKPQLTEGAPLPGMFRLDDTHFGLPLAFAHTLDDSPGFVWQGHRPMLERGPAVPSQLPIVLSGHARADLQSLVDQLAAFRAQAVIWDSGLGRRVFTLAAVEALDAWPALIVAPAHAVWVWQRHLDLIGRTHSLTHDRSDAQIITYWDLMHRRSLPSPQAIIFDDLSSAEASGPGVGNALHRLDGVLDAYRIACGSSWPQELAEQVAMLSVLRPGEFRPDLPLAQRYPVHTVQRAAEHVGVYLSQRSATDPGSDTAATFRRSSSIVVEPSAPQQQALAEALERRDRTPEQVLAELLEIVSAGPAHAISPKIAVAARKVRECTAAGRRVALVTRHRRCAQLVRSMLRPLTVAVVDEQPGTSAELPGSDTTPVVIVRYDLTLPNLRGFDEVVVLDYPWSAEVLERSVGSAADEGGPHVVTCVHMAGTVDDRLAMLAARRREIATVAAADGPPGPDDIAYLLTPRWTA